MSTMSTTDQRRRDELRFRIDTQPHDFTSGRARGAQKMREGKTTTTAPSLTKEDWFGESGRLDFHLTHGAVEAFTRPAGFRAGRHAVVANTKTVFLSSRSNIGDFRYTPAHSPTGFYS
jgi:hypothetical protein